MATEEHIPRPWVSQILEAEESDGRFEDLVVAVTCEMVGVPVVGTAKGRDKGRDGRAGLARQGIFLATTLQRAPGKPRKDAKRLAETTKSIRSLYIYTARNVLEDTLDAFVEAARKELPEGVEDVTAHGASQLGNLIQQGYGRDEFLKLYRAEIDELQAGLRISERREVQTRNLGLALSTFSAEDGAELRIQLAQGIVLSLLQNGPLSVNELFEAIRSKFGLTSFMQPTLARWCDRLCKEGLVEPVGPRFRLTTTGRSAADEATERQAAKQLEGAKVIRKALEKSLALRLETSQWTRIFAALQREVSDALLLRGSELAQLAHALAAGSEIGERHSTVELLQKALANVAAQTSTDPLRARLSQALNDVFLATEPTGASEWLASVAARFCSICSLGLAPEVYEALTQVFGHLRFVFDTDAVVSYLCPSEAGYQATIEMRRLSQRFGRHVVVPDAAAEETARHAMKAHVDHERQIEGRSAPLEHWELESLHSAFTREFEIARAKDQVTESDWATYIERIAGPVRWSSDRRLVPNTGLMRRILVADDFKVLPAVKVDGQDLARRNEIAKCLFERRKALRPNEDEYRYEEEQKSRINADLLLSLEALAAESQENATSEHYVLVTSDRLMHQLPHDAANLLKFEPQAMSLAEAAYLVTLLPDSAAAIKSMRAVLFEGEYHERVDGLGARLLSVLSRTNSVSLPGSSRGVLLASLSNEVFRIARESGESAGETRRRLQEDPVAFGSVAALIVDAHGIQEKTDRQELLDKVEAEFERLKETDS